LSGWNRTYRPMCCRYAETVSVANAESRSCL
jgi:hypothetical protein